MMNQLDTIAEDLYSTLQDLDSPDLAPQPFMPAPHDIITYAHKIRYTTFFRSGTASLPPAPQPWQMNTGALAAHGRAHMAALAAANAGLGPGVAAHSALMLAQAAAKQEVKGEAAKAEGIKADVKTEQAPPFPEGYLLQGGAVLPPDMAAQAAAAAQAQPAQPVVQPPQPQPAAVHVSNPALDLLLNADMEEVEDVSDSDDDDDDWD